MRGDLSNQEIEILTRVLLKGKGRLPIKLTPMIAAHIVYGMGPEREQVKAAGRMIDRLVRRGWLIPFPAIVRPGQRPFALYAMPNEFTSPDQLPRPVQAGSYAPEG